MKTRNIRIRAVLALAATAFAAPAFALWPAFCKVDITPDHQGNVYSCGETAKLKIRVNKQNGTLLKKGDAIVVFTLDGGSKIFKAVTNDLAKANPFVAECSLDRPGFLMARVYRPDWKSRLAFANLAFSPEKITQAIPEPEDFDRYWAGKLEEQRRIKDAVTLEKIDDPSLERGYKYFKLSVKTATKDGMCRGFLAVPEGKGPFSVMSIIQAAGPGYNLPDPNFQRPDMMTLSLNVHPWDPCMKDYGAFFKKQVEACPDKKYTMRGFDDRETFWMLNAILGCKAAIDYVRTRPDSNGKLYYTGSSQGGGMGIIMAGLTPEMTAAAVMVPALCDFGGAEIGRREGWPYPVRITSKLNPAGRKAALGRFAYFDAVNFAKRVRSPISFTIGFCDECCPASSVYAAYNNIPCGVPKTIFHGVWMNHGVIWPFLNGSWQWLQGFMPEKHRTYRQYFQW